jgi:hypothetical protein
MIEAEMKRRRLVRIAACLPVLLAGVLLAGCSRRRGGFAEASGTLASMPQEIPELRGRGVWIRHDGLYVGAEKAEPMRAPFELAGDLPGDLKVGDRVVFKFRPRPALGFPFEAKDVRRLTGPPPTPHPQPGATP